MEYQSKNGHDFRVGDNIVRRTLTDHPQPVHVIKEMDDTRCLIRHPNGDEIRYSTGVLYFYKPVKKIPFDKPNKETDPNLAFKYKRRQEK